MTQDQYERWKDFATRMAKTAFRDRKRPDTAWILSRVERVFENLDGQDDWIEAIRSWDHNAESEERNPLICDLMLEEMEEDPDCPWFWHIRELKTGQRPAQRAGEDWPAYWARQGAHEAAHKANVERWEAKYADTDKYSHDREMMAQDRFDEDWFGPVRCCLRAGLDLACEPSAGVLGFTVGTLREMYPEGIPAWISDGFLDANESPADIRDCAPEVSIWL